MIPLRDDQPCFSTPFVNYFLIAVNLVAFLWELSIGHRALNLFMVEFGVVPHHAIAVLTGHSHDAAATAILPSVHLDVPARFILARRREHALSVDLWRQR